MNLSPISSQSIQPVSNLPPHLPPPNIRHNLSPCPTPPLPTPHLPPPPPLTNHHHHKYHHHNHHHHNHRHILSPHLTQQHSNPRRTQLTHLTNSRIPFPSVLSSQSSVPRPLCNPVPSPIPDQVPTLHRPQHHRLQSITDHPIPEISPRLTKYRRLETTTHVSTVRRIQPPAQPHTPISRALLPVINTPYETQSQRDDGYSTGSRETAPLPESLEDDEIETPYTCAHCAARFPDREQRKQHIKSAHEKPFVCAACNSRFTRKFDLEKHSLTVHEGMRPFQCDICNASFGQKHHLVRHKRAVHAKARDFACDSCNSRFARKEHLGNHKRAVHEKREPYMCALCDVQYYERRALRRHLEQVHSVKSTRASVLVEWQPNGSGNAPSIQELVQM